MTAGQARGAGGSLLERVGRNLDSLIHGYAAILLIRGRVAGLLCLLATFWYPNVGMAGLLAAVTAVLTVKVLRFPHTDGLYIYNSLLVGLSLGASYQLDLHLVVMVVLSALLAVLVTTVAMQLLWRNERLPALSLPFVVVALVAAFAGQAYGELTPYSAPFAPEWSLLRPMADAFFTALGATFFAPHAGAGLLLFAALLFTSPYLALLGVLGFAVGHGLFLFLTGTPDAYLVKWAGFNFILTAIAVGGIFLVPGRAALALALAAAALAAMVAAAAQTVLLAYGLPVLAIPFLFTTLTLLSALRYREPLARPWLTLHRPDLPERTYERSAVARARMGDPESTPLAVPFMGTWQVYQGFDDRHTHQPPWQHALDFYVEHGGRSFSGEGSHLADYYCFGLPVVAPADAQVVAARGDLPDNAPGEMDTRNNWGNYLLMRLPSGRHVLLAHLRQGSLRVGVGQWVRGGEHVANCGNSGRSPQPHLHLQVQAGPLLGEPTCPFHLSSVIVGREEASTYRTYSRPARGDWVRAVARDAELGSALHLPVGLQRDFVLEGPEGLSSEGRLEVFAGLDGLFRLAGSNGSSAALEEYPSVVAFYDREGGEDPLLDLWLLNLGLCPLAEHAIEWSDSLPARLLPLGPLSRLALSLRFPLGALLESRYRRQWDGVAGCWRQRGEHRLRLLPGWTLEAVTETELAPGLGATRLSLSFGGRIWRASLIRRGIGQDDGIPGWSQSVTAEAMRER